MDVWIAKIPLQRDRAPNESNRIESNLTLIRIRFDQNIRPLNRIRISMPLIRSNLNIRRIFGSRVATITTAAYALLRTLAGPASYGTYIQSFLCFCTFYCWKYWIIAYRKSLKALELELLTSLLSRLISNTDI